jgi:PLD-like domain
MRFLDDKSRYAVQQAIDANAALLESIAGFVRAEPGFPLVDGTILREPAVIVYVVNKKPPNHLLAEERAPRQLGPYRVSVMQADPMQQLFAGEEFDALASLVESASAELTYVPIDGNPIDATFQVSGSFLCHVGPDAGWPILRPFLEATETTLSVAMYDFNADYISKTFIDTVRSNDVKAVLTWDDSMTAPETSIRAKLKDTLGSRLDGWVVQCGGGRRFASAYHEKVAVRDSRSFWLSSGNWSKRSQPEIDPIGRPSDAVGMYSKGNREWHVIVDDAPLAQLFERYIRYDRDGSEAEKRGGESGAELSLETEERLPDLFVPLDMLIASAELATSPEPVAAMALPSSPRPIDVVPVLTPDNYIGRIRALFASATRSIYLQFSYITYPGGPADGDFRTLLRELAELSYRADLDVRIIVGSNGAADKIRKLVEKGFRDTVFRVQANVHNKGIIIDGKSVLVSSANWSGDGVLRNRDAGLIIHDREIAGYYQSVFLDDWENRARSTIPDDAPVMVVTEGAETPPGMVRISWRDYYD